MRIEWRINYEELSTILPGGGEICIKRADIVNFFHIQFWAHLTTLKNNPPLYNGVPIHKNPGDLCNYQQIIFAQQPEFIIECGAFQGGATLYFANLLDLIGKGRVVSIDICEREGVWHEKVRNHPRVTCLAGSSTDPAVVDQVREIVGAGRNNFVILDSLHTKAHVLAEMEAYSGLLGPGNYLIVEDSNLNGHPILTEWYDLSQGGGPFEAIETFMQGRDDFAIDRAMEQRFLFSFAPSGYLQKHP